jgi:hypothetical protein
VWQIAEASDRAQPENAAVRPMKSETSARFTTPSVAKSLMTAMGGKRTLH